MNEIDSAQMCDKFTTRNFIPNVSKEFKKFD